jgi:hypothetical protein
MKDFVKLLKVLLECLSQGRETQSGGRMNGDEILLSVSLNDLPVFCFHRDFSPSMP